MLVLVVVKCQKQELQFIQERPEMVSSKVAVKSPLCEIFSSMHNLLVAGHGESNFQPKLDHCDKLQKQT